MLGLKLNLVSKGGPMCQFAIKEFRWTIENSNQDGFYLISWAVIDDLYPYTMNTIA